MPTHRFRIAESVDSPRLAVGAPGVDFVLGQAVPAENGEPQEEAVEAFETEDEDLARVLAENEALEYTVVVDGQEVSPEEAAEVVAAEAAAEAVGEPEAPVEPPEPVEPVFPVEPDPEAPFPEE